MKLIVMPDVKFMNTPEWMVVVMPDVKFVVTSDVNVMFFFPGGSGERVVYPLVAVWFSFGNGDTVMGVAKLKDIRVIKAKT